MKYIIAVLASITLFIPALSIADEKQETCLQQVKAAIAAIDANKANSGKEEKLNGYSKEEINTSLETKNPCDVLNDLGILPFKK